MHSAAMNSKQDPCVVVGDLNLVHSLALARLPVVVASSVANRPAMQSRYCQAAYETPSPTRYPEAFVEKLIEVGRLFEERRPMLYYDSDTALIAISEHRDELAKYYRFHLARQELVRQLTDKIRFLDLARYHDLPIPRSYLYTPGEDPRRVCAEVAYPCIVKPATRGDWFGSEIVRRLGKPQKAIRVENAGDLSEMLPLLEQSAGRFVIQELVDGGEANIVSYHCYVGQHGDLLGEFTGRKIRTYPAEYGVSSCVEVQDDARVKELGWNIVERLGLRGIAKLDLKIDARSGEMRLLEINPRYSLWNYPGARAGVNLPAIAYHDIIRGDVVARPTLLRRVKWIDFEMDLRALLQSRAASELGVVAWLRSLRGIRVYTLWSWSDPVPCVIHAIARVWMFAAGRIRQLFRRSRSVSLAVSDPKRSHP
jgi:predicted ATP-grasp superfamily ATP-dependent carboligase